MDKNYLLIIKIYKNFLITLVLFVISLFYSPSIAFGKENINSYKSEYVDISFVNSWDTKEANLFALVIEMKKNWKTYWRNPGDSGFEPEFKVIRKKNLKKIEISWPTPKVFYENGTFINGYKKNLVLPIFFYKKKSTENVEFEIELIIGFCDEICIPVKLVINNTDALKATKKEKKLVSNSLAERPKILLMSSDLIQCEVKNFNNKIILISKFENNFFSNKNLIDQLIIEYIDTHIWFSGIKKIDGNFGYMSNINSFEDKNLLLDKSKIKYTIITKSGGFEQTGCKSPKD